MSRFISFAQHPKGLWVLALTELCERFAFWGVGNLLVLYLLEYYQFSEVKATHIYGIFTGCAAFLPLVGGWIADRWNYQKPMFIGALTNMIGCLLIATGILPLFYVGLVVIAGGFGLFTPSILAILGHLYQDKEKLREAGFSIYYASINIGVFLALFSLGIIAKLISWNAAFLVAAGVQFLGIFPILWYFRYHKISYQAFQKAQKSSHQCKLALTQDDRRRVTVIVIFCVLSIFFWMAYNQGYSSMTIFVHSFMNKNIAGYEIPEGVFLSSESFFLILLAPVLASLYAWLQRKKKDPSVALKTMFSFLFLAVSFLIMTIGAKSIPQGAATASVNYTYIIGAYFSMAVSEMLFAPIGLSMVSLLAPRKLIGLLIGFWYVCLGIAYYIGGWMAGWIEEFSRLDYFFALFILIALIPALYLSLFHKKLTHNARRDPH